MDRKKGYYIHFDARQSIGVSKKIDMQIAEFGRHFCMQEIPVSATKRNLIERIMGLFPWASITREYDKALSQIDNPDFIYVRRAVADYDYMAFFRKIKEKYSECKVIIEIFTYPYDKDDFAKWDAWPFYIKEILNRRKFKKYVDRFVTYSKDKEIFGVQTICTTNGVDVDRIKVVSGSYTPNQITLVGVAYMQRQHGYERIIKGLNEYYAGTDIQRKVYLYLVGDGPEKKRYQELVNQYNLQEYVKFYPTMTGEKLDEIYNGADIALAAFGLYKVGFYQPNSTLKVCECLAKGMPFATGCSIAGIDDTCPFMFLFPNNESSVSISDLVSKFDELRGERNKEKSELAQEIRMFAEEKVSIGKVMRPIVDYINGRKADI